MTGVLDRRCKLALSGVFFQTSIQNDNVYRSRDVLATTFEQSDREVMHSPT